MVFGSTFPTATVTAVDAAKRTVTLSLDGHVLDTKSVDVPASGRATVEFLSLESPYGFHKAEIRIQPSDSLREDDRFAFAVERADPRPVLFLHTAGQQRRVESFGERDVDRVVAGEILPQLPRAGQQRCVRCSSYRHRDEVVQRELGAPPVEPAGCDLTTEHGRDFDVQQVRCGELLAAQAVTQTVAVGAVVG